MKNFPGKFLKKNKALKKILFILFILTVFLSIAGVYVYNVKYYVIVRFDELGPLTKNTAAYYNGFKIGKIVRIKPDNDFKHTLVKVNLNNPNINLPQNTTVHVQNFPNGEIYLQFIYPSSPSFQKIKRGDTLEGISPYSLEQFMLGQNISGVTDIVTQHVIQTLNATKIANMEMAAFFKTTTKIVNENSTGIKASVNNTTAMTKSLAQMAENLKKSSENINQVSKKLNNAIDETNLKSSTSNINSSTSSLKDATDNIAKATKDFDKTMKKVDDTVSKANSAAKNLNSMTGGLNETLSKRFGGMRVMFGTPVKPKNGEKSPCQ